MVCDTIHEIYFPAIVKKQKGAAFRKDAFYQARANPNSAGTNQPRLLQLKDIEGRYESVHDRCRSASEKLKEALQCQIVSHEPLSSARGVPSSFWITNEEDEGLPSRPHSSSATLQGRSRSKPSSIQRPKSQQSRRLLNSAEPGKQIVIRDNTVCANEWISECSPKVWLMDVEKELWVQQREAERRRWQAHKEALSGMKKRAVPFEIWLAQCKHAEQIADDRNLAEEKVEHVEVKVKEKRNYDYLKQGPDATQVTLQAVQRVFSQSAKDDWQKCFQKLAEEYHSGRCDLVYSANRQIERIVHIAALWLENLESSVLVQLGIWSMGKLTPTCRLPAMKQTLDESPEDAVLHLFKQDFAPLGIAPRLGTSQSQTHWNDSPQFGVRTKYVRTVVTAKMDVPLDAISCVKAGRKPSLHNEAPGRRASQSKKDSKQINVAPLAYSRKSVTARRSFARQNSKSANQLTKVPEMYMLWHGDGSIQLCTWISPEEFDHLRGSHGERQLKLWLSSVLVDPTVMPPRYHYVR